MKVNRDRLPTLILLLGAALVTSRCGSIIDAGEDGTCQQTYGFANYGCAEIAGRVLSSRMEPLAHVSVGPRYLIDSNAGGYGGSYVDTDADGRFRFRIERYLPRSSAVIPDTFSIFVHAAVRPQLPALESPAHDSIVVLLELTPVGATPNTPYVEIQLKYPDTMRR